MWQFSLHNLRSILSVLPHNPDLSLKEVITLCKEDAINEANTSDKLYETAEENLQSVLCLDMIRHDTATIRYAIFNTVQGIFIVVQFQR